MIPKKIYLNYVNEDDKEKTWSKEPVSVNDCDMQNREYTDLSQVWHNASEEPMREHVILVQYSEVYATYRLGEYSKTWAYIAKKLKIRRWAYVRDLLPKIE